MMRPEFLRPFDAAAACRGAPFCCANGWRAEVFKYVENGLFGTITKPSGEEYPASWSVAGESDSGVISKDKDLVMLPLGRIEGKPVFVGDRLLDGKGAEFTVTAGQVFGPGCLCKWAPPAKVYPETTMTDAEIQRATPKLGMRPSDDMMALSEIAGSLRALINAALRHAVDACQVAPVSEARPGLRPHCPYTGKLRDPRDIETDPMGVLIRHVDEPMRAASNWPADAALIIDDIGPIYGSAKVIERVKVGLRRDLDRADRDMAIAEAVLNTANTPFGEMTRKEDLATIISTVK